jgi:predicted unusual protein kinase regulating ubiquinone biosynthesis (AarF/ABC1/UbiB family)
LKPKSTKRKFGSLNKKEKSDVRRVRRANETMTNADLSWVAPLATEVKNNAEVVAAFLSEVLARVAKNSSMDFTDFSDARWLLTKNIARMLFPSADGMFSKIEGSFQSLEAAFGEISAEILRDSEVTRELLTPTIEMVASTIESNPQLVVLLADPEILSEAFGEMGERMAAILNIIPALSQKASDALPELRETLFIALYKLPEADRQKLFKLAETILQKTYKEHVFPRLEEILSTDPRGRVLAPILKGAIEAIPGEACLNAVLSMASTVRSQLNIGRVIAIAIQKLGGLYVKISQVIAELSPPSLARELRTSQDDAGGLFPSDEQSWEYLLRVLSRPDFEEWKSLWDIPALPQEHFASASVGALYEIKTTEAGKTKFGVDSVLIKLQRPGLGEVFRNQSAHLLKLCDESQALLFKNERDQQPLSDDMRAELLGIVAAIRRAILNYYKQSASELDFTCEKENAERASSVLGNNSDIKIPKYFYASPDIVVMERIGGTKVTRIVQTKYLARRDIADALINGYLELLFEHGVVWADPHPGNILFDDTINRVAMIDLNPCFVWSHETREEFKHLLYKLLLRDAYGLYSALYDLVDDPEALQSNRIIADLERFLISSSGTGSLLRFVGEFIKTLSENGIDLKVEVQAALRGLSQLALTASSVSSRNSFGKLLRKHFRVREMLHTAWQIGPVRVFKVLTGLLFEITKKTQEEDVGPVLDERDIAALSRRIRILNQAGVCDVQFSRVNPEDHPNLKMSTDESALLITSDLVIQILEKTKPATVRYVVEIPSRDWLRERQEFVKLASVSRNFCIIECLEQIRRNSLDDYWRIVECWNKSESLRTVEETRLVGEVRTAARRLYALRFRHIWDAPMAGVTWMSQWYWRMLILVETLREESFQQFLTSIKPQFSNVALTNIAFGTFYRLRMLAVEAILYLLRKRVKRLKYSMHLLPMSTSALENLILFGLSRNMMQSPRHK